MGFKRVLNSRMAAVGAGATVLALLAGGAGYAAGQIDSRDIKNNSVRSVDVKNGTLTKNDLNRSVLAGTATRAQITRLANAIVAQNQTIADLTDRIEALEDQDQSGVNTNWEANAGSSIVSESSATLTGGNTSVEIENLNKFVQAGTTISFTVQFGANAFCVAGAPRVFVEVNGTVYNSFDQATPCANDTAPGAANNTNGTIDFTVPVNGRIGAAGLVWDNGNAGTVTISNLKIGAEPVKFQ
jgi:hypothetical protein